MSQGGEILVIGNLGAPEDIKFTAGGIAYLRCSVAQNHNVRNNDGSFRTETTWFSFTLWREAAENAAKTFEKGMRVLVAGRMSSRSYETNEGSKVKAWEIADAEVGVSLLFASAAVTRTPRANANEGGNGGQAAAATDPVYGDEEPF